MSEPTGQHLHLDEYPQTLELVRALVGHRDDRDELGYSPTEHGAHVDWDRLTTTHKLSSTEKAAAQIARGCATLERAGGTLPGLARVIVATVAAVAGAAP